MVHALQETHRVLKPNGILVDLRPAAKHRRIGLGSGANWKSVGVMREVFDEDHAADRAVKKVLSEGWFRREWRTEFQIDRVADSMTDFRTWLEEFVQMANLSSHDWLLRRVENARNKPSSQTKIAVRGPLKMAVLRKLERH